MSRGIFIVFEGGEKVGKTTQIKFTDSYLQQLGYRVVCTREPGGGDPSIREKLLNKTHTLTPEEELGLFCKDRRLHMEHVVRPALEAGSIVLCDRFEPSTIAYQGYGRGMDIDLIREHSAKTRGGISPDLIILLDANPTSVLAREEATTRFDVEDIEFHNRVRDGFLEQARKDSEHWRVVDAARSKELVWNEIKRHIDALLTRRSKKLC